MALHQIIHDDQYVQNVHFIIYSNIIILIINVPVLGLNKCLI